MNAPAPTSLISLRGLRTAPSLSEGEATALAQALQEAMDRCEWFTVGVMAPSGSQAVASLRSIEGRLGWEPLAESPVSEPAACDDQAGGVFLKGNQNTGLYTVRQEAGLGEGILISGHNSSDPAGEDTWGPFPLSFFA
uniref:DUF1824 family protein n=1 Tax=Cyanobium sp. TaxID=2164130 RepID=UPI00404A6DAD